MLLYNREGQDESAIAELLAWLDQHNTVSRGLLLPGREFGPMDSVKQILGYAPSWIETFSNRQVKMRPLLDAGLQEKYGASEDYSGILDEVDVRQQLKGRDELNQSLYLCSQTAMAGYILTMLGDRMEMAYSIEGRVPFLDHKVVETIVRHPIIQKVRGMTEKQEQVEQQTGRILALAAPRQGTGR